MEFALETPTDGRRARLHPDKPLVMKVKRGDQPGGEIEVGLRRGRPFLDNRSTATCTVNGTVRVTAELSPGDQLQLGAMRFRVVTLDHEIDVVEPQPTGQQPMTARVAPAPVAAPVGAPAPQPTASGRLVTPLPASDSDRQRNQRRISASRLTSIEPQATQSSGILKRVSAAFSGRADRQRLDQLEAERRAALLEAGRRSLGDGSALGIPGELMAKLQRGEPVTLSGAALDGLAKWRDDRQRLVRLDAEIAALRQALALGPDPDAVVLVAPHLRSDEHAKVERAFETMDAVGTQELEPAPPVAPSVRRPPIRRR